MVAWYLWINALLYVVFAALCSLRPEVTSGSIGFLSLNRGGQSEFLAVYGGLELGLALVFAWMAWRPELQRTGLAIALLIYAPTVLFRCVGVMRLWPVPRMTLATGALEMALLLIGLALWFATKPTAH
ncbi:DUF4345 domain-containing protein [Rhodanobacter sp. L36]|uniref:DUF4345 domain-containing protein n=1 Tax=Rhodanobacter sp. L36 TaxID=1747221 RepID=UPI00131B99FA|nr:DUF4345 domain-containing protein [Rhodanobacter sp. L36]